MCPRHIFSIEDNTYQSSKNNIKSPKKNKKNRSRAAMHMLKGAVVAVGQCGMLKKHEYFFHSSLESLTVRDEYATRKRKKSRKKKTIEFCTIRPSWLEDRVQRMKYK